ncbi:MAG: DnaJ C-terminal domain-containing protein [Wenzhouxiangellaceae bacterium]|nr:DnaJ C-terminal domain-containing protein [Wenzhouxiangellaceae bacterium]
MEFKDYYSIMGVEPGASADEIKRAYRRLARKYHPDVSSEADAEARFKEVGEAWEVLKDPDKRAQYDQLRERGWQGGETFRPPPDWQQEFDFSEFADAVGGMGGGEAAGSGFSDFFESLFGGARRRRPARGRDMQARIEIDLETAFRGGTRRITLERGERGRDGRALHAPRTLEVNIPPGMTEGKRIRLAGKGDPGPGRSPAGDLFLEVHLLPHPLFEVDGLNVELTLPIAPWEAGLGAEIAVPTLAGRVQLKIPAGAASDQRLRLKGRGLPGTPPGDQYVRLKIVAPPARTEEQRFAYERARRAFDFDPRAAMNTRA